MHRFLFASAALLLACSSTTTTSSPSPATESETPAPGEETPAEESTEPPVAFTDAELQAVFDTKCVRCHAGATTPMDLRSFKSTTIDVPASTSRTAECSDSKTPTRIVPGDRNASLLWHKVTGTQDCGDPMPPPSRGTKLSAIELERLGLYIDGLIE
jgi:hypothetical protein